MKKVERCFVAGLWKEFYMLDTGGTTGLSSLREEQPFCIAVRIQKENLLQYIKDRYRFKHANISCFLGTAYPQGT